LEKPKILLVDDVNLILELEKSFVKHLAVDVLVARNGEEALDVVRRTRPDLIFMDLNMPVMDGSTCCSILKVDPVLRVIPVIMVTTAGRPEDEELCRKAGCDDFVTKPINGATFLERTRAFLANFERRRQRMPYTITVEFLKDGELKTGQTADISSGGLFMATQDGEAPTDPVYLSFPLPGKDTLPIMAKGRVAWENHPEHPRKADYPPGFGIEFTGIDPFAASFIEAFIEGTRLQSEKD
jgi:CheY-like chemotaxis protein